MGLTIEEKDLCKELELRYQPEYLSGGYPKIALMFREKLIRANDQVNRMMEICERLEGELKAARTGEHEEALKEKVDELKREMEHVAKRAQAECEEKNEWKARCQEMTRKKEEMEAINAKYARMHLSTGPLRPIIPGSSDNDFKFSTTRQIQSVTVYFRDPED